MYRYHVNEILYRKKKNKKMTIKFGPLCRFGYFPTNSNNNKNVIFFFGQQKYSLFFPFISFSLNLNIYFEMNSDASFFQRMAIVCWPICIIININRASPVVNLKDCFVNIPNLFIFFLFLFFVRKCAASTKNCWCNILRESLWYVRASVCSYEKEEEKKIGFQVILGEWHIQNKSFSNTKLNCFKSWCASFFLGVNFFSMFHLK